MVVLEFKYQQQLRDPAASVGASGPSGVGWFAGGGGGKGNPAGGTGGGSGGPYAGAGNGGAGNSSQGACSC